MSIRGRFNKYTTFHILADRTIIMYPTSSQRKFCTYSSEQQIQELRLRHNADFITKHGEVRDPLLINGIFHLIGDIEVIRERTLYLSMSLDS